MGKLYTTIVVGPDGREFDLGVMAKEKPPRGFPANEDYVPVNAYTVDAEEYRSRPDYNKKKRKK